MASLTRNTIVYGIGVVLSRAVGFLMLPIYTRFLTPGDYGVLTLLQMTTDITAILLSAGTTAGVLRFYFKVEDQAKRHTVIDTSLTLLAALNGVGALGLALAAPWVSTVFLRGAGGPDLIHIVAGSFFLESFIIVPLLFAQAQERAGFYVTMNALRLVLQVGLNLLFLVGFGWGVAGLLLGTLGANLIVGTILTAWTIRQTGYHLSWDTVRDLRRYGVPYQFVTAGTFVLTFGDRLFLQAFHGVDVVGLYGLAYQFGFILMSLGALPMLQAWNPKRFQSAGLPREERDRGYAEGFLFLNLVVVSLAVAIALFISPILSIMTTAAFHPAGQYVPVILAAYVLQAWMDVVQFGIDVSERTVYATAGTWIGVVTILILYALLIPPYGAMGAALATLGGFAIRFACYYGFAQRLWPITYQWPLHIRLVLVAVATVLINLSIDPVGFGPQILTGGLLSGVFGMAAWFVALRHAERVRVAAIVGRALHTARQRLHRG